MLHVQGKPDIKTMLCSDSFGINARPGLVLEKQDLSLEDSLVNQASEGSGTEGLIS